MRLGWLYDVDRGRCTWSILPSCPIHHGTIAGPVPIIPTHPHIYQGWLGWTLLNIRFALNGLGLPRQNKFGVTRAAFALDFEILSK